MQHNNAPQKMKPSSTNSNNNNNNKNGNKMSNSSSSNGIKSKSSSSNSNHKIDDDLYGHNLPSNPYNWSEEEVVAWIKHIGYSQYMDLFHEQHVNGEALLALTKDEFGQIGIYALGHTKNILSKIQKLKKFAAKYKPKDPYNDTDIVYSQDKQRDKNTYWELWSKIVSHRDFMLEHDYKKLMSRSGLAKHDIDMIWKLSTSTNHGRCSFDEFTSIMKLSHLCQLRIPLYIINVSKLIFYHPPLASTQFYEFSSIFSDLQKQQVLQNMVGFYNLPSQILDSDDRLMELEKKALRIYHPIHFEINAKVLIATFSSTISDQSICDLEKAVLTCLKEQMGFLQNAHDFSKVYVQRPSPKELGMTPSGPNGQNGQNHSHSHSQQQQQQSVETNGYRQHNGYNGHGHSHGYGQQNDASLNVESMQNILMCDDFWEEFRHRSEIDKIILSSDEKIRTRQAMTLIAKLRNIGLKSVKFTDEGVKLVANKSKYELMDQLNNTSNPNLIHLKATILGLSDMDIPNINAMQQQQQQQSSNKYHNISEDVYKGIVIEGLPEIITNDDENIRKLDSAVLNEFIVSHIEVVDNVLRITFANEVTHKNINQLRKYLKSFLKDDIKLDKKSMKNVSIIPHTRDTWKGETTERSVEVHNQNGYHVGMDSITATPQQQPMHPHYYHQ